MQSPHTPSPTGGGYDPAFDPFYNPAPMPGPNLGTEPASPGGSWMQSPHTPGPQIDNPAFPGGSPFFNPTPSMPTGGADDPAFGPFFNPTPQVPTPTGGADDPGFSPFHNPTFDFPSGSKIGWEPAKKGDPSTPWAYFKDNGKKGYDRGLDGGFGLFHGEDEIGGVPFTDDILTGQFKLGGWDNGQDGMRHGIMGNAGVAKMGFNNGGFVSGDAEAFTAAAEASWGDDGATLGAQATLVGGSMTLGGDPTKASNQDTSVRVGLSEGIGLAGRLHWGDKDGDKHSEYGFGADFGPFSFDMKSEDPLGTLAHVAAGSTADWILGEGNTTDKAKAYADQIGKYAGNAYDSVSGAASSAYDAVSDYLPW
jgi:hypothetical protein